MKRRTRLQQLPGPKAAKPRRNRPEEILHRALASHLTIRPAPNIYWLHVPNGGWRSKTEAKILKSMGVRKGTPDLLLCRAGKLIAIELKSPKGRVSKHQREAIAELTAAGCMCRAIDNIDDAVAWLEKLGFLRGRCQ
jgi:hypothetical protein